MFESQTFFDFCPDITSFIRKQELLARAFFFSNMLSNHLTESSELRLKNNKTNNTMFLQRGGLLSLYFPLMAYLLASAGELSSARRTAETGETGHPTLFLCEVNITWMTASLLNNNSGMCSGESGGGGGKR